MKPVLTYRKGRFHRSSYIALVLIRNHRSRRTSYLLRLLSEKPQIPPQFLYPTGHFVRGRLFCFCFCFCFRFNPPYQERTRTQAWQQRTRVPRA
jgi:hypothetical protein